MAAVGLQGYAGSARLRPLELLPWVVALAVYFFAQGYLSLGSYVLIIVLFALSLDLIVGYGGILTIGHAAYFGFGAYVAGVFAVRVSGDPLLGLLVAGLASGIFGAATGSVILRTQGLALLMLTLAISFIVFEIANKLTEITGGTDGLRVPIAPVLGVFRFDIFGRTAYLYCLAVLLVGWWLVRTIVYSPFGCSLVGTRENAARMHAIGAPVYRRRVIAYTISASIAGVAGGLLTQTTQFVGLSVASFELSGDILIMLVVGGVGRIYGAFVGPGVYIGARDYFAKQSPEYWYIGIGILLVVIVMFARGGILGLIDKAKARVYGARK